VCIQFYFPGKDNIIENCIIKNCKGDGIHISEQQNNLKIINCTIESVGENAINFYSPIYRCTISGCKFINSGNAGIDSFLSVRYLNVNNCHFQGNRYGIVMNVDRNLFNRFSYNNFMNKEKNILFIRYSLLFLIFNRYTGNYWNDYKGYGFYHLFGLLNWDFNPVKEPHNIWN
jgi:parallel beta-helix repeat protein